MEIIKKTTPIKQPVVLENLHQLENACLHLRRAIVNLSISPVKKILLLCIDSLIDIDICSYLEEVKNKIKMMRSIVCRISVTSNMECQLIYLNDVFLEIYKKSMVLKAARFKQNRYHKNNSVTQ